MSRRRPPRWNGWYVCEWKCGARYRRGADYVKHVILKHQNGAEPFPSEASA